jgi:recombinational DNA repair protein (RecF pathway)
MGVSNQIRICDGCGKPVTYLGKLPTSRGKPAVIVFRCYGCNAVASVPVKEVVSQSIAYRRWNRRRQPLSTKSRCA